MPRRVHRLGIVLACAMMAAGFGADATKPGPTALPHADPAKALPPADKRVLPKVRPSAKTVRRKSRQHAVSRSRRQRLLQLQAEKDTRLSPRHGLMGLLGLVLAGLGIHQWRQRRNTERQFRGANPSGYQPRPVVLGAPGTDPLTFGDETGIHQIGVTGAQPLGREAFRGVGSGTHVQTDEPTQLLGVPDAPGAPDADAAAAGDPLDFDVAGEAERAYAASEIDRLTGSRNAAPDSGPGERLGPSGGAPVIRLAAGAPAAGNAPGRPPPTPLPPDLAAHYAAFPGETLLWKATFAVPLDCSGLVALTNQRLLAVYERHLLKFLPPGIDTEVRRHQSPLNAVTGYAQANTKRPAFLVVGLLLFMLYPFGTLVACVSLSLFFGLPRRDLAITSGGVRRLYPLPLAKQAEIAKYLDQFRALHPPGGAGEAAVHKQVG